LGWGRHGAGFGGGERLGARTNFVILLMKLLGIGIGLPRQSRRGALLMAVDRVFGNEGPLPIADGIGFIATAIGASWSDSPVAAGAD